MADERSSGVSLHSIGKAFGRGRDAVWAVRGVNLEIARGEFLTFIGHSGCGKSTLLNMIAGLEAPTEGELTLDGEPIVEPAPDRAVVFQHYSLLPWLTVTGNVSLAVDAVYASKPAGERRALVDDFLQRVGLHAHRNKRPAELSGGMKQRVAIARAMAVHPKLLLLDEPFGAVDALTRCALQAELLAMWGADKHTETVVMVTHDIDEAIYLSDRIVVMTDGPAAKIASVLTVPLPRPRDRRAILRTEAWLSTKERLLELLTLNSRGAPA